MIDPIENIRQAAETFSKVLPETTKSIDETTSLATRTFNALTSGLKKWVISQEYGIKLHELSESVAFKLKEKEADKIINPDAYIAVPALQAASYSMESPSIKDMYAALLAKAMYTDTKDSVHPSYTEIIKQLSSEEASFIKEYLKKPRHQSYTLCRLIKGELIDDNITIYKNMFVLPSQMKYYAVVCDYFHMTSDCQLSITDTTKIIRNLNRLGLVTIVDHKLINNSEYDIYLQAMNNPEILSMIGDAIDLPLYEEFTAIAYFLCASSFSLTSFGKDFMHVVVDEIH